MRDATTVSRRDALKTAGAVLGGVALGSTLVATPVAGQATYYRYDAIRVQLVDTDTDPPEYQTVETELYLSRARLADCPAADRVLDVLDYAPGEDDTGDDVTSDDADDDDNAEGDDDAGDGDVACPGFAAVVLLCHADSAADSVAVTGLLPDVLAGREADYVVALAPTDATAVRNPEPVSNPCAAGGESDDEDEDDTGDNDDDSDDGSDDTDSNDDSDDNDDGTED